MWVQFRARKTKGWFIMLFKKNKESWSILRVILAKAIENNEEIEVTERGMLSIKDKKGNFFVGSNIRIGENFHVITKKMLQWLEQKEIIIKQ